MPDLSSYGVPEKPIVYRSTVANFVVWLVFAAVAFYFLTELGGALERRGSSPVAAALTAICSIGFLIPAIRYPVSGVWTNSRRVVVRNIFKTYVLRWEEVQRFELTRSDTWPKAIVRLKTGTRIPLTGVQYGLAAHSAEEVVGALNRQLVDMERQAIGDPLRST